eukprot:6828421-Alexandrium_andersonii.AAC.1
MAGAVPPSPWCPPPPSTPRWPPPSNPHQPGGSESTAWLTASPTWSVRKAVGETACSQKAEA